MRVLHTIAGLGVEGGGPSLSTYLLVKGLRAVGVDAHIVTYGLPSAINYSAADDTFIHVLPNPRYPRWGYTKGFETFLRREVDVDLYHAHGLWQYAGHAAALQARRTGKPYFVSPRGMLYPEALRSSGIVKKVALSLYQKRDLDCASCVHATCEDEAAIIRSCGVKAPIVVIPNPIEIGDAVIADPQKERIKRVGYLGRFAPIKNIESLVEAWAQTGASDSGWELVLVGDGDPEYRKKLIRLAERRGIRNILFPGFLTGADKNAMLATFSYLVLPSKSENFGMVVLEALMRGIPVIASKGTPWAELEGWGYTGQFDKGEAQAAFVAQRTHTCAEPGNDDRRITDRHAPERCGWWVDVGVDHLVIALRNAMMTPDDTRRQMGRSGRLLVESRYLLNTVAEKMKRAYQQIAAV